MAPAAYADELKIVAGYASPAMVSRVLAELPDSATLHLVVGMAGHEGVVIADHEAFTALQEANSDRLRVAYTTGGRSIHTKLYVWSRQGEGVEAYVGSSNFTQNGFLVGWRQSRHSEVLARTDPSQAMAEFARIESESLSAIHPDVENEIELHTRSRASLDSAAIADVPGAGGPLLGAESLILPLVAIRDYPPTGTVRGEPHRVWGLNWGVGRGRSNRNEASILIPQIARDDKPNFFPRGESGRRVHFLVGTDDNKSMFMSVAEQGDKALHSVPSNGALGEYFRFRLGVANGAVVTLDHLRAFGSRFVKFFRLDDETYHMIYSPDLEPEGMALYGFPPL